MVTNLDKALSLVIVALVLWLNQKYGFSLPADPNVWIVIIAGLSGLVWAVPNKTNG